jgi:hypothetical protein
MSVSSITSNSAVIPPLKPATPEALETSRAGPDHDGDADDRGGAVRAAQPVVNTSGQPTGLVVNTKA